MSDPLIKEYWKVDGDSPTGLSWLKHKANTTAQAGDWACTTQGIKGYYTGRIGGRIYYAHRVVFFLTHGYWPEQVDHIDGDRGNNNVSNLRGADASQNQQNRVCNGCYFDKQSGKWKADIRVAGKRKTLGRFTTQEQARAAYLAAKRIHHPTAPERCYVRGTICESAAAV